MPETLHAWCNAAGRLICACMPGAGCQPATLALEAPGRDRVFSIILEHVTMIPIHYQRVVSLRPCSRL